MKHITLLFAVILLVAGACLAAGAVDLSKIPEGTRALYEKFKKEYTSDPNHWEQSAELIKNLAVAPDADLCFLDAVNPRNRDMLSITALEQLGKLNTQRTFDIIAAPIKSKNWWEREDAIWEISEFKRPECVTLLLNVLENDANNQVRQRAAEALEDFADPRAEEPLLRAGKSDNIWLAIEATKALGALNSKQGLLLAMSLMESTGKRGREYVIVPGVRSKPEESLSAAMQAWELAITAVARYHTKRSLNALVTEFATLSAEEEKLAKEEAVRQEAGLDPLLDETRSSKLGWVKRLRDWTDARLRYDDAPPTVPVLGPMPDPIAEEWTAWWSEAEPLLTDDLKLKTEKPAARQWREEEFAKTAEKVSLIANVDAKTYRVGDPIRLELLMKNEGRQPCSVVLPCLPSGWMSTMAYGIKLKKGGEVLAELAPSDVYEGSYSGPPPFETLGPGEEFRSSFCFQCWVQGLRTVAFPLPEGGYEVTITFDSSKFSGIKAKGVELVHRWELPAVKFVVKGEAVKEPEALLKMIGEKARLKFLLNDLSSPQPERRDRARQAIFEYGDSRLAAWNKAWGQNLRPFERAARKEEW